MQNSGCVSSQPLFCILYKYMTSVDFLDKKIGIN